MRGDAMRSWRNWTGKAGLVALALAVLFAMVPARAEAVIVVRDFEGLQNLEPINDFYNGGTGACGSSGGTNYGIAFTNTSLAVIAQDAGGTGNFANEPSPSTILFFLNAVGALMNVAAGFDTGFSFFYTSVKHT